MCPEVAEAVQAAIFSCESLTAPRRNDAADAAALHELPFHGRGPVGRPRRRALGAIPAAWPRKVTAATWISQTLRHDGCAASGLWSRRLSYEGSAAVYADDEAAFPQHFHGPADRVIGDLVVRCEVAF